MYDDRPAAENAVAIAARILIVEGDDVVAGVLSRVLANEGHTVARAVNAVQAMELADRDTPQLAILDWGLRDGKSGELAKNLARRYPGLPLIAMSGYPLRVQDIPASPASPVRVLTKPVDVKDLRSAVNQTLLASTSPPAGSKRAFLLASLMKPRSLSKELHMRVVVNVLKVAGSVVLLLAVLAGLGMAMGAVPIPWKASAADDKPTAPPRSPAVGVELVDGQPYTLSVPEDVRAALGIRKGNKDLIVEAKRPNRTRPLVMPGSTALDPTRIRRIRARFAPSPSSAEVVEIGQVPEDPNRTPKGTVYREIRSGDHVQKGQLLAVFYSVDVGNKKNDLVDAIYQLKLDEEILKRAEAKAEAVPEVFLLSYRRNVQGDINTINRAVNTLKTWGIPEEDIQAVRDEAENVKNRQGKHDKEKEALWARVEIKAPDDGVIIERNVSLHEIVVDNTTNLFQIANLDKLSVFANVPEDDLPALEALPTEQRRWKVETVRS